MTKRKKKNSKKKRRESTREFILRKSKEVEKWPEWKKAEMTLKTQEGEFDDVDPQ